VPRSPGLQVLSRQHHQALVLARHLRAAAAAASTADDIVAEITRVQVLGRAELAPHFHVEERELLPLSHGQGPALAEHAATVRRDHAALREMLATLSPDDFAARALALATRLEEHVRFEERHWFPALEAALDEATAVALTWRLDPEPRVPIVGFRHEDGEDPGVWVAGLACGHGQHVRHKPPFQEAAWVLSAEGRAGKLGVRLPCVLCRMPRLPPRATTYKETPVFDERSVPAGLLSRHTLRADTWGRIVVLEGRVDYVIESDPPLTFVLRPGVDGGVAPEQPHHVTPQPGARFQVCFLR
jgi:tellurite methyltransferase